MTYQMHRFIWRDLSIEVRYDPCQWNTIAHLEVETINPPRAALPITETGYRSHYHPIDTIERDYGGDVIAAVTGWLDAFAATPAWIAHEEASKQGDLFA